MATASIETAPAPSPVTCPLCGLEYAPGGATCREHGCPIALGGCAIQHCPRCGYTMPDEAKSGAARLIRRLFQREPRAAHAAGSLAELPAGSFGVVERLPTYVIEVGETTIGLERDVAAAIVLRQS